MIVVADTSGIVAAMDPGEPEHGQFRATLESAQRVAVTAFVITEVHHLLSRANEHAAAADFLSDIEDGFYEVWHPAAADFGTARELIKRYEGAIVRKRRKPGSLDLSDAMNVIAARDLQTPYLVAIDQDYRQVQPLSQLPYFVLLPADG